jgi:hypothetical protein
MEIEPDWFKKFVKMIITSGFLNSKTLVSRSYQKFHQKKEK